MQNCSECSIFWFPDRHHTELAIDGRLYNLAACCVETNQTVEEQKQKALSGGADYYEFHLKLSFEEKQKIIERLSCQFIRPHTCSGNIAYVLSSDTNMTFPWCVTWLPSTFAEHLYIRYHEHRSRVVDITYVGTTPDANILKAFSIGRWAESYFGLFKLSASFIGIACGFNPSQIILLQFFSSFLKKFK